VEIAPGFTGTTDANMRVTIDGVVTFVASTFVEDAGTTEYQAKSGFREYCFSAALHTINLDVQNTLSGGGRASLVRRCRLVLYKTSA
jgi:hypothetical protein